MSGLADSVPPNENDPLLLTPTNTTDHAILTPATIVTDENQDQDNSQQSHNNKPCDGSDHPFCSRYANKKVLGQYIPEIDENHVRSKLRKTAASKRSKMLRNQFITATIIGLANIATLVCVWVYFPPDSRGIGTLRMGDCSEVTTIDSAIHMVLNVVSSLFLGAGSYCMQILVAPSRREMDDAHSRGISLDIGVQSLRNLRWIKRNRIFQWGGIGLLSICLHLFWNSLTFTSTPVVSYASATVTSDFQAVGRDWASDPPRQISSGHDWSPVYDLYSQMANFTRLDKQECIDSYIDPLKTKKPVIVVASNVTTAQNDNSPVISGWVTGWDVWSRSPWWICQAYNLDFKLLCSREWAKTFVDDWTVLTYNYPGDDESNRPFWIKVDYCLVGLESDISRRCGLHYGTQIFIVLSGGPLARKLA
ncbi:hypothetical protein N7453_000954 [Penicillium expansum]|nr:hypothetical protein N7453_000954 [Penicillium expansum]